MAIAVANVTQVEGMSGNTKLITADVTLDTSYPTGGSPGLAGMLGLNTVNAIDVYVSTGFIVDYIKATDKLQVFNSGGGGAGTKATEVTNATALNGTVVSVLAIGKTG